MNNEDTDNNQKLKTKYKCFNDLLDDGDTSPTKSQDTKKPDDVMNFKNKNQPLVSAASPNNQSTSLQKRKREPSVLSLKRTKYNNQQEKEKMKINDDVNNNENKQASLIENTFVATRVNTSASVKENTDKDNVEKNDNEFLNDSKEKILLRPLENGLRPNDHKNADDDKTFDEQSNISNSSAFSDDFETSFSKENNTSLANEQEKVSKIKKEIDGEFDSQKSCNDSDDEGVDCEIIGCFDKEGNPTDDLSITKFFKTEPTDTTLNDNQGMKNEVKENRANEDINKNISTASKKLPAAPSKPTQNQSVVNKDSKGENLNVSNNERQKKTRQQPHQIPLNNNPQQQRVLNEDNSHANNASGNNHANDQQQHQQPRGGEDNNNADEQNEEQSDQEAAEEEEMGPPPPPAEIVLHRDPMTAEELAANEEHTRQMTEQMNLYKPPQAIHRAMLDFAVAAEQDNRLQPQRDLKEDLFKPRVRIAWDEEMEQHLVLAALWAIRVKRSDLTKIAVYRDIVKAPIFKTFLEYPEKLRDRLVQMCYESNLPQLELYCGLAACETEEQKRQIQRVVGMIRAAVLPQFYLEQYNLLEYIQDTHKYTRKEQRRILHQRYATKQREAQAAGAVMTPTTTERAPSTPTTPKRAPSTPVARRNFPLYPRLSVGNRPGTSGTAPALPSLNENRKKPKIIGIVQFKNNHRQNQPSEVKINEIESDDVKTPRTNKYNERSKRGQSFNEEATD